VIAPQRILAEPPRRAERVREATRRRTRRARSRLHAPVVAVVGVIVAVLVPLLAYVTLTSNLTSLSYALARQENERAAVLEETQRLDDRIARLRSPDRLAAIAANLKMHDPHVYAVVRVPQPKAQQRAGGFAFLGWLQPAVGITAK
jgi:cytochrome c-type biogenesis protein CcmH/NrfG